MPAPVVRIMETFVGTLYAAGRIGGSEWWLGVGVVRNIVNVLTAIFVTVGGLAALGMPLIAGMGVWERVRLNALRRTRVVRTGELAGDVPARVAVQGELVTPERLTAPLAQTPCVWYRVEVRRGYERAGGTTDQSDETVWTCESSAPLAIDDGSGPALVRLNLLDKSLTVDGGNPREFTDGSARMLPGDRWYREHEGLARLVDSGLLPEERLASPPKTLHFTVHESVIPVGRTVTLVARVKHRDGTATLVRGLGPAYGVSNQTTDTLRERLSDDAEAPWGMLLVVLIMLGGPAVLCVGLRLLVGLPLSIPSGSDP